jgi:transcriptional regulator with XRE-family HTH domain
MRTLVRTPDSAVGQELRKARENAHVLQDDVCRVLDIAGSTLSRIERGGIRKVSPATVYLIRRVIADLGEVEARLAAQKDNAIARLSKKYHGRTEA